MPTAVVCIHSIRPSGMRTRYSRSKGCPVERLAVMCSRTRSRSSSMTVLRKLISSRLKSSSRVPRMRCSEEAANSMRMLPEASLATWNIAPGRLSAISRSRCSAAMATCSALFCRLMSTVMPLQARGCPSSCGSGRMMLFTQRRPPGPSRRYSCSVSCPWAALFWMAATTRGWSSAWIERRKASTGSVSPSIVIANSSRAS